MSEKVTLSPFAKKVKTYLSRPKNFDTPRRIAIYVLHCYHAVHLGLLSRTKFVHIVKQMAILRRVHEVKQESFYNPKNYRHDTYRTYEVLLTPLALAPLTKMPVPSVNEWLWFFSNRTEHEYCYECEHCACGCGKTRLDFQREKYKTLATTALAEQHQQWHDKGYSAEQIRILEIFKSACKDHGRHRLDDCICDENNILAEFQAISRDWLKTYAINKAATKFQVPITKIFYSDGRLINETKNGSLNEIAEFRKLSTIQKRLVSRHFYFCHSRTELGRSYWGRRSREDWYIPRCRHFDNWLLIDRFAKWLEAIYNKIQNGTTDTSMYSRRYPQFNDD